jgi:hypothetical protein
MTDDIIIQAARFLATQVEYARHQLWVDEAYADFERCARRIRGVVDGPAPKRYLGPCGAEIEWAPGTMVVTAICEGDVYGVAGASKGSCRTCGAQVDQGERRAWLDREVAERMADTPMRAADIGHAIRVSADTIRTWTQRGKLSSYWWDGERYVPWVEPREGEDVKARGPRLHYVADVMDLQRQAADRRAQLDARRERRDTQAAPA